MTTIATATNKGLLGEALFFRLFTALSARFGGDCDELPEDEIQRLVDLARAGDRAAGQRLYRKYVDRVYRTVRGMLKSDADAEDVTQDAMLTVLTSLNRYSAQPGARFIAWVTTIAVNTARRRFRKFKPEILSSGDVLDRPDTGIDLELDVDTVQKRELLLRALADLGQTERDVISFRYGAELNASEIAEIVNLNPANVRKMLERARVKLRKSIESATDIEGEVQ